MRQSPLLTALLLAVVLLLAATVSRAGGLPSQPPSPTAQVDHFLSGLARQVTLTPSETNAVRTILVEQTKKRNALLTAAMPRQARAAALRALPNALRGLAHETDAKLAAVLPPEKMAAVRAYAAARHKAAEAMLAARHHP